MPETPQVDPKFRAARNRTGVAISKFRCLKADAANGLDAVTPTTADTDVVVGVSAGDIANGANGDRCVSGRHQVTASAAIAAGAPISAANLGKVQTAIAGDRVIGYAVEAAAADLDVIMAELTLGNAITG